MTKKSFCFLHPILLLITIFFAACKPQKKSLPQGYELACAWADLATYITKTTPANSPTFASRAFGYFGLTMYESVVNGYPEYQSVASQLNGLSPLAIPQEILPYNWPLALNAGQAEIIRSIYVQTSNDNKRKIDSLEMRVQELYAWQLNDEQLVMRSVAYGKKIAQQIFQWSLSDGGHRAYMQNFDKSMVFAQKPGCWQPPLFAQSFSHYPLHPHWGKNRTFLSADSAIDPPAFIAYDSTPGSGYYNQFLQVIQKTKTLTQSEKEAAIWWSDDPDVTFTPPGHSYYLATIAIKNAKPSLIKAAETYAKTGIAVADAFRNCWKWKYMFFSERPNTFVPQHIDQHWESFWPDPPFPAFPSGHAMNAGAVATVLTSLYGDNFAFTDSAHYGRPMDEIRNTAFKCRSFKSFWEAAHEIADSRFFGGIHTPQDNARGLEKGSTIAANVIGLKWKK